jgi:hypothetical protein
MLATQTASAATRRRATTARPSVTDLFKRFEQVCALLETLPPARTAGDTNEKAFERAVTKAGRIAEQIVSASAITVDEMLLKILVAGWCGNALPLAKLKNWKPDDLCMPGEEFEALASLREDLRRLCRGGFIALSKRFDHRDELARAKRHAS